MTIQSPTQITISPVPAATGAGGFFSSGTPGFSDIMDTINPLEHIPVVSAVYDAIKSSHGKPDISPAAEIAGGALFGGVFGMVGGLANVIFKSATGHSIGTAIADAVTGKDSPVTQVASADPSVHLGDFNGDIQVALRTRSYENDDVAVAQNAAPAAPPVQTAMAGSDKDDASLQVADAAAVSAVTANAVAAPAPTGKDAQVLSLFDSAGYSAYQKAATNGNDAGNSAGQLL
ncbi:MAG: hypothetical protein WDN72_10985 [Alphaproteobacteria bacterium]